MRCKSCDAFLIPSNKHLLEGDSCCNFKHWHS